MPSPGRLIATGWLAVIVACTARPAAAGEVDISACPHGEAVQQTLDAREQARELALPPVATVRDPAMQRALIVMVGEDQSVREALSVAGESQDARRTMMASDARHLPRLREMLAQGFPTPGDVGYDGVSSAWLLVQHADADPALQRRVLDQLTADPARYATRPEELALLTDRVLLHEGHPQRYGTQFESSVDGEWRPQPIADVARLEARRAEVGLMPMDTYRCVLAQMYAAPVEPFPARDGPP